MMKKPMLMTMLGLAMMLTLGADAFAKKCQSCGFRPNEIVTIEGDGAIRRGTAGADGCVHFDSQGAVRCKDYAVGGASGVHAGEVEIVLPPQSRTRLKPQIDAQNP